MAKPRNIEEKQANEKTSEVALKRLSAVVNYGKGDISPEKFLALTHKPWDKLLAKNFPQVTIEVLTDKMGCSHATIQSWQKSVCYPGFRLAGKLATYLGVSIDDLAAYLWDDYEMPADNTTIGSEELAELLTRIHQLDNASQLRVLTGLAEMLSRSADSSTMITLPEGKHKRLALLLSESLATNGVERWDVEASGVRREFLNSVLAGHEIAHSKAELEQIAKYCCHARDWNEKDEPKLVCKFTYSSAEELVAACK